LTSPTRPWTEKLVPAANASPAAVAARTRLQAALTQLNPAGGFIDDGDGTGRHANREENARQPQEEQGQLKKIYHETDSPVCHGAARARHAPRSAPRVARTLSSSPSMTCGPEFGA
jgi:hypothetical protein